MDKRQEEDFELAREEIAEAMECGGRGLSLMGIRHLTTLPPEISDLTALQLLDLDDTQVADITPLAGLTALNSL